MRLLALLVLVMGLFSSTALAQTYQVTGVGEKDSLNVRSDVDKVLKSSEANVVGSIPFDGEDISTTGIIATLEDGSRWREIVYKDLKGWVNSKYLEMVSGEGLPGDLNCSGTEPFWQLEIRGDKAALQDFGGDQTSTRFKVIDKRYGQNRGGLWSYHLQSDDMKSKLTALVKHMGQCSPGIGELEFALEIYLLGLEPDLGPAQGCCSFNR